MLREYGIEIFSSVIKQAATAINKRLAALSFMIVLFVTPILPLHCSGHYAFDDVLLQENEDDN